MTATVASLVLFVVFAGVSLGTFAAGLPWILRGPRS